MKRKRLNAEQMKASIELNFQMRAIYIRGFNINKLLPFDMPYTRLKKLLSKEQRNYRHKMTFERIKRSKGKDFHNF